MISTKCRQCGQKISKFVHSCPVCGASHPASDYLDGKGYEYISKVRVFGIPLLHISFKYRFNGVPVPARGIIAIGQFAIGVITVSQFGIGFVSASQITIAGYALAQIGVAYSLIAQLGFYINSGYGQVVKKIPFSM